MIVLKKRFNDTYIQICLLLSEIIKVFNAIIMIFNIVSVLLAYTYLKVVFKKLSIF